MESNVQKMIEAFGEIQNLADALDLDEPNVVAIIDKCKEALDLPLRNCDVGTAEEQVYLHREWCYRDNDSSYCCNDCRDCFARWAQMPYEADAKKEKSNDAE